MTSSSQPLSTTQRRVQQNFQRGFRKYNDNAYVQKHIAARLIDLFAQTTSLSSFQSVLEIGCGTGFLTQELVQRLSVDHWTINDLVNESRVHIDPILNSSAWDFLPGAIETIQFPKKYDLIASSSAIQWIADTPALLKCLSDSLNPGGWLILSSFGPEHFRELQTFDTKPCLMSYIVCDDWRTMLSNDFDQIHIDQEMQVAKFGSVRNLLMHLRNTGVNANAQHQWSRQRLAAFELEYTRRFSDRDQNVCLTYAPVYIIAQKQ